MEKHNLIKISVTYIYTDYELPGKRDKTKSFNFQNSKNTITSS